MPTYTIEQIYQMLMTSTFETWYEGAFTDHVVGEECAASKEQIMDELNALIF